MKEFENVIIQGVKNNIKYSLKMSKKYWNEGSIELFRKYSNRAEDYISIPYNLNVISFDEKCDLTNYYFEIYKEIFEN